MAKIATTLKPGLVDKFGVKMPEGWEISYIDYPCDDEALAKACEDADFLWIGPVDPMSAELMDKLDNVKLIQSLGVGFDKINLDRSKEKGIFVCNNRAVNAISVAEHALGLILSGIRRVSESDAKIKSSSSRYMESFNDYRVHGQKELGGMTVGLVGLGAIGKELTRLMKPFGCKMMYYDIFRNEAAEKEYDIEFTDLDRIFKECDVISLHVPVTEETKGLINDESIGKMKQDALIINVARGEIVDNEALKKGLEEGKVFAGLDVIAPEPPSEDHPLLNLSDKGKARLTITPHIAGTTDDAFIRMQKWSYENMEKVHKGEKPNNIVNGL